MRKMILFVALPVLLLALLAAGCSSGVSREEYDKTANDLAAAQAQVKTLQDQNNTLQTEKQSLQDQLKSLQTKAQSLEARVQSVSGAQPAADLQKKIDRTKPYWALFNGFYQIVLAGQAPTMTQAMELMSKVQSINDPVLNTKMQAVVASGMGMQQSLDATGYLVSKIDELLK